MATYIQRRNQHYHKQYLIYINGDSWGFNASGMTDKEAIESRTDDYKIGAVKWTGSISGLL
jgi:hypothetical protein